jgi:CHRD domain
MGRHNGVRRLAALVLILLSGVAAAQSGQRGNQFAARITTVPISPAERSTVTGSGSATARLFGRSLRVQGAFAGLQGPATTAVLRQGPVMGVRGPTIATLEVTQAEDGQFSGEVELSSSQIDALREGRVYVQIDSAISPDGNLWGWLLAPERRK